MTETPLEVVLRSVGKVNSAGLTWRAEKDLSEDEITSLERDYGKQFPEKLKSLLRQTGCLTSSAGKIEFETCDYSPGGLFPNSINVLRDECGNFWVIDTMLDPERMGPVFFVCHDPAVIVYEARDLSEFLDNVLNAKAMADTDGDIWTAGEAAGRRDGDWVVFDLRAEVMGSGAPLNLYYDDRSELERIGNSLVFRLPYRSRNWWQRFRDRWR